ncbi:MAG: ABC transporter ATP-binding protein [Acidobacteria bacterium]|nr:ABC transporter ATP-binding protein [Acidobacteriota bacterium]
MIEARRLGKNYGSLLAVNDVSFSIRAGEILGYIGPNGAGKSTTVKMLTGLLEPSAGEVLFNGRPIQRDLVDYKRHVGYVPEDPNLYPYLTAREYLDMIGTLRNIPRKQRLERIDALLKLFLLYPQRHAALSSYSKGMRQKVLLISGLMHNPSVIILDEPLSGLDVTSAFVFRKLVSALARRGKAIFYCSHVLEVVEKLCSHLLILKKGTVVAHGATREVLDSLNQPTLEDTFAQLVPEVDATAIAADIVEVVCTT